MRNDVWKHSASRQSNRITGRVQVAQQPEQTVGAIDGSA
jgi:hypothetical protein